MSSKKENNVKTALITGGTSGIGLSIAKELILQDYNVVIVGRNKGRGQAIANELNVRRPDSVQFVALDLSIMEDVKNFAIRFAADHEQLHVLANIAGIMLPKKTETKEGLESIFATNYLSAFLLSETLVPILERTPGSRIVNVAAAPSQMLKPSIDFENLQSEKNYNGFKLATITVRAKTVLTEILADKYASKGIDVISFDPGLVRSNLMGNMPLAMRIMIKLMWPLMSDTSSNGVYACSSKDIQGNSGMLYCKKKAIPIKFEQAYKDKLWKFSEGVVAKILEG